MKYTKEELLRLKNDSMAHRLASYMGVDLDQAIDEELQAISEEEHKNASKSISEEFKGIRDEFNELRNTITNNINELVKQGVLTCEEETENGVTRKVYRFPEEKSEDFEGKKEYVKPEVKEQPFLMNAEQLEVFINNYRAIIEAEKKLSYLYGIELHDSESGFSFPGKVNEIIWDFVRTIFGDENAEDIADYIFGNSNFDNVKSLYNELV